MHSSKILKELLCEYGIVKEGHYKLTTGFHSSKYINKDKIITIPLIYNLVINCFENLLLTKKHEFDIITGPAIAGITYAAPLAKSLMIKFVYPEKENDMMVFKRDFPEIIKDKRVCIIEDIVTTGGSIKKVIDSVKLCNGKVSHVFSLWNRGYDMFVNQGFYYESIINEQIPFFTTKECPKCANNVELRDPKTERIISK